MKTINTCKAKLKETKAWFRSHFPPPSLEMDRAYFTAPVAHTGQDHWKGTLFIEKRYRTKTWIHTGCMVV